MRAMDLHDVGDLGAAAQATAARVGTVVGVGVDTDLLYVPGEVRAWTEAYRAAGSGRAVSGDRVGRGARRVSDRVGSGRGDSAGALDAPIGVAAAPLPHGTDSGARPTDGRTARRADRSGRRAAPNACPAERPHRRHRPPVSHSQRPRRSPSLAAPLLGWPPPRQPAALPCPSARHGGARSAGARPARCSGRSNGLGALAWAAARRRREQTRHETVHSRILPVIGVLPRLAPLVR